MAKKPYVPKINQLLDLKSVGNPRISPDGKQVAYTVRKPNWTEDRFVSQIWIQHPNRQAFTAHSGAKGGLWTAMVARWEMASIP